MNSIPIPSIGWSLQIIQIVVSAIWFLAALYFRSSYVSKRDFGRLKERVGQMENRGMLSDEKLKSLATKTDIQEIVTKLASHDGDRRELAANVAGLARELKGLERPLALIEDHLLNRGR